MAAAEISCVRSEIVGVVRRYSRQPHLWKQTKALQKVLVGRPAREETSRFAHRIHKLDQRLVPFALVVGPFLG